MKKTVLVTSILFSSMLFGVKGLADITDVKAENNIEVTNNDIVVNKIKFVDQDGIEVPSSEWNHKDDYGNCVISGKIGDPIDLNSILPTGYGLQDKNQILKFISSGKVTIIKIIAKEITNTINFVNEDSEIVKSIDLNGKVGEVKAISKEDIPDDYDLLNGSLMYDGIKLSFDKKEVNVNIIKKKVYKNININFIDEKEQIVSSREESYPIGERVNIKSIPLPEDYALSHNNSQYFAVNNENNSFNINVKKYRLENNVDLEDGEGNVFKTVTIYGGLGERKEIPNYILDEYELLDSNDKYVEIKEDGSHISIKVKKNIVKNKIEFKDSKGNIVGTTEIKGRKGTECHVDESSIPENYILKSGKDRRIKLKDDNSIISINVLRNNLINIINLKDLNGIIVDTIELNGHEGKLYDINQKISKKYYLVNDNDKDFIMKDDDKITEINVLSKVMNKIEFVTESGYLLGNYYNQEYFGKVGDTKKIEQIHGYEIIGNDIIKLNSTDGFVHRVVLKGKTISTKLVFEEMFNNFAKELYIKYYTGQAGTKLPAEFIREGYVLDSDSYILGNRLTQTVFIKKIIDTQINYVDPLGKLISSKRIKGKNWSDIKLSIPKGYLLVNNPSNSITITEDFPVQNVLVVPTNGIQQPELPNIVSTQINFIDRKNNKVIHSYIVQGQHGQSHSIQVPEGYDLAKGVTNKLTLDKSKKLINIYMVEKESINTNGVIVSHSKTVLTKQTANLYDKNGKRITNRALGHSSGWKSDQKMVLNGVTYYRVATNEYVRASDIVEYEPAVSVISTTNGSAKYLYDIHGKRSSNRALSSNTAWFTDKLAIINGEKMYRVATNEWVKASDIK